MIVEKRFIIEDKTLMQEWDWEKNNSLEIFPEKLTKSSKLKVWWKCKLNHEWENTIYHRTFRLQGCPYCSNNKIWKGYNDLATTNPEMLDDWDYELNTEVLPTSVSYGSNKKVWWKCKKNHSYFMAISDKRKQGCPICSNKKVLVGYNDLSTTHPDLLKEWNYYKNKDVLPTQITYGSNKKVWWKCCKCNYEWVASPSNRTNNSTKGTGCPCCSNRIVVPGINDLATTHPDIAKRWHPTLNKLKATEVVSGCNSKAYFTCYNDSRHYFYTRIDHMILDNIQCPICANQTIIIGVNDLATTHPELLKEWDFDKNTHIKPTEVTYGNNKKAWWKCVRNHSWSATIASRAGKQKTGCPICKKELFISFPEKVIAYYLEKCCEVEENKKFTWLGNSELDIFLPKFNLAVEYDGQAWHKDYLRDLKKDNLCKEHNIHLIRVREELCPVYKSESIKIICKKDNYKSLTDSILFILNLINKNYNEKLIVDINIDRDYSAILGKMDLMTKENSIANSPLINEWNWDKNKGIKPETVQLGTHKKYWWICSLGHEWKSAVYCRIGSQSCGCPYCAGQKVLTGWNDLATLYPNILNEWNYKKNTILPDAIRPMTNKKYWWICSTCNYEWLASPAHRVGRCRGCPKCARQKTIASHFKRVLCIETNTIFNSVKDASIKTGLTQGNIANCCRGSSKTAGGYHWKYLDNEKD